ncbi:MAG: ribonuclease E inhibitor RraB, partial [Candidatus Eremiobacteraeota bacterium]|nr:ribonuclease E inhibitor RraB [Candidatus Eremiobacteraeota bacterium]
LEQPAFNMPMPVVAGDTADLATLDGMRHAGADLSKPTEISHYLYFPTKDLADQAAVDLRSQGYKVTVDTPAMVRPNEAWLAQATQTVVPSIDYLHKTRVELTALAAKLGGTYDGWEAAVKK